ncbi:MAG: LD-carboxypeptidase [Planctomycetota bacterium]
MAEPARKPKALRPGDTIMMVAPAGELIEKRVHLAVERLKEAGFKVIVPDDLFTVTGYLAGPDERRAAELMRAFTDPEVDAVFPGTGGYGVMRILDLLDFDAIRANPKVLIGFSDITGLHSAISEKCGFVTFHTPNPQWGLGSDDNLPEFSAKYFWRSLLAEENANSNGWVYEVPADDPVTVLSPGVAEGPACGGNLSLVAAMTGSDYQLSTDGNVLFLEDVREAPYRIDRMLCQLKLSGQLDKPAAVLLGKFRDCDIDEDSDESSFRLADVFEDYFRDAPYPVISNFPAGHVTLNATIPFGVPMRVDAERREVRVLENPVSLD